MTGVEIGLAIGLGALGLGVSVAGAAQQNAAAKRAMKSAGTAASIQARQVAEAGKFEQLKAAREAELVRGRMRVAAAAAGIAPDVGVFSSLAQQEAFDYAINQAVTEQNIRNQIASVLSGGEANIAQIRSQMQNPLLAGIGGAIQGVQTGLAIGSAINSIPGTTGGAFQLDQSYQPGSTAFGSNRPR